jgi:hypothetical protein
VGSIKEAIRAAQDIATQRDVEITEWGVTVEVRGLPSGIWEAYQNKLNKLRFAEGKGGAEMNVRSNRAEIVARCLYDQDTGERVFPDVTEGAIILSKKAPGIIDGLFKLCRHLSGEDRDFEQKVRDAEGNSDGDQS